MSPGHRRGLLAHALRPVLAGVLAVATITAAGCGCAPAPASTTPTAPTASEVAATPEVAAPLAPAEALAALEQRMLTAKKVSLSATIHAEGAFRADLTGTTAIAAGNWVALVYQGTFMDEARTLSLASDGTTIAGGGPAPAHLGEAVIVGMVRMGMLHNLAQLGIGKPIDHADGGVAEWVVPVDVVDGPAAGAGERVLDYALLVDGERTGRFRLILDAAGLPRRREVTVEFPGGTMKVTEDYRDVVIE